MSKLLYVEVSPRGERSYSRRVAEAFLAAYVEKNPGDGVDRLNVFEEDLPAFNEGAVTAKYKIMHGAEHTKEDRQVWGEVEKVIERFMGADKVLFSVPMWNFGVPYKLKHYIDLLVQPGYTFKVSEQGYQGLVTGKPVCVVYARGGEYSGAGEGMDFQKRYMDLILGFMGFTDIRSVVVEPTLASGPETAKEKLDAAKREVARIAREF